MEKSLQKTKPVRLKSALMLNLTSQEYGTKNTKHFLAFYMDHSTWT